jgi:hypothetical protein
MTVYIVIDGPKACAGIIVDEPREDAEAAV